MEPLKLTMTAFGPYKYKEVIDFEQLKNNRLFVISGATGSGKTTIFDAISFALYGSASGSDRDNVAMLRSDFADEDTHTEVELIFELKGRKFRTLRRLAHLKSGNKTRTGDKIEFFEVIDGVEIPAVERQIVSMVDQKIQEIIGLTADQFKQIVMLPQGEFRKLLTSETENKEAILRRLFKTEKYQHLNNILKEKRDYVTKQYEAEEQMKKHFIQSIHTSLEKREGAPLYETLEKEHFNSQQVMDGLEIEIKHYEETQVKEQAHYEKTLKDYEKKQAFYHQSLHINEQFQSLEKKQASLIELESNAEEIQLAETALIAAERASIIEPYENQLIEKRKELNKKTTQVEQTKKALTMQKEQVVKVKEQYETIANKQTTRDTLARELEKLNDISPIVRELENNQQTLKKQEKILEEKQAALENNKKVINEKTKELDTIEADRNKIEQSTKDVANKKEEVTNLRLKFVLFRNYRKASVAQDDIKKDVTEKESIYIKAKEKYEDFEAVWLQNQAVLLAHELHEGESCPVCGSIDHPHKAKHHSDIVTRELLEQVKEEMEQAHKMYLDQLTTFRATEQQLNNLATQIKEYEVAVEDVPAQLEEISTYGKQLNDEVTTMENALKKDEALKKKADKLTALIKQANKNLEQNREEYQKTLTKLTTLQATFEERIRNIALDIQNIKSLEAKITEVKQEKLVLDKEWEDIQNKLKLVEEETTKTAVTLSNEEQQLNEINEALEIIESSFILELRKANFETEEMYAEAKKPQAKRNEIKKQIEFHKQSVLTLKKQIEDLTNALKDKEKHDLVALEKVVVEMKLISEVAFHQLNESKQNLETVRSIHENIRKVNEQSASLEKQLATVTNLHDVMRGRNDQKLSFERYVQIDYLEQIMYAANERLQDLSNGQYHLIKSDRLESGGRQSGLSIDVFDAYTGQTRDVKTLSGGEKFNASLALALGMSDVIQSFQGNISIDTMFIDEGFGSLDEESLIKAIDTLIDLQKTGRMIGVISHVDELKSVFPATLEVTKTKEGYSQTTFVLK